MTAAIQTTLPRVLGTLAFLLEVPAEYVDRSTTATILQAIMAADVVLSHGHKSPSSADDTHSLIVLRTLLLRLLPDISHSDALVRLQSDDAPL